VAPRSGGWSVFVAVIGSTADAMLVHFRPTLDEIGEVQRCVAKIPTMNVLTPQLSFLSVTEAGMYHLTAQLSREAKDRGGTVGDDAYKAQLSQRLEAER